MRWDFSLRFDDRLKTALLHHAENGSRTNTQWAQLVDIMSQNPNDLEINLFVEGLYRLRELMTIVPEKQRVMGVQLVMGRLQSLPLLQLLAGDTPMVALNAMRAAKLSDDQWAAIIPTLPTRARGFLRNRDDLGPKAQQSLGIWASADFILPSSNTISHEAYLYEASPDISLKKPSDSDISDDNIIDGESPLSDFNVDDADDILILTPETSISAANIISPNILNDNDSANSINKFEAQDDKYNNYQNRQRIDEIVAKIENLRSSRETYDAPQLPLEGGVNKEKKIKEIYFATDNHGIINWVDGVPRGALVGTSLSEPSYDGSPGPDAAGAAAFKQRLILENARMKLCGPEIIEGDWRINATPFFDIFNGRFKGYKGLLRRPNIVETAGVDFSDTPNDVKANNATFEGESSDNLQQLIHELRTPLGAVIGFAEIIEQQLFGPASSEYRVLAKTILDEGNRLLSGFDDLNVAAKIDSGHFQASLGVTDCGWLIQILNQKLSSLLKDQNIELMMIESEKMKPLAIENDDAKRLFVRLLSSLIVAAKEDEKLIARWQCVNLDKPTIQFSITLPMALQNMNEQELFESGPERDEDNRKAPLLGLGFSLRLVRNLVNNIGGNLLFYRDLVILNLPAIRDNNVKNVDKLE